MSFLRLPAPRSGRVAAYLSLSLLLLVACAGRDGGAAEAWRVAFDDGAGWEVSSDAVADVGVSDGVLRVHVLSVGQVAWATSESRWGDVHVSVDATQVSGPQDNEYGVLARMQDDESFTHSRSVVMAMHAPRATMPARGLSLVRIGRRMMRSCRERRPTVWSWWPKGRTSTSG